jgi:hypothetical protein
LVCCVDGNHLDYDGAARRNSSLTGPRYGVNFTVSTSPSRIA